MRASFGGPRRGGYRRANSVMIRLLHRPKHLVSSLANVRLKAMGHLHYQPAHVAPLQHPIDCIALPAAIVAILRFTVHGHSDVRVAEDASSTHRRAPPGTAAHPPG